MKKVSPHMNKSLTARQRGFGLVELMVAMVLGLILIGGVLNIFLGNQQAFRSNEGLARLQENARVSFELMARDIREAGSNLCGVKLVGNVVNNANTTWSLNWSGGTVVGTSGTQTLTGVVTGTASGQRVTATDAIQLLSASLGPAIAISGSTPTSAQINVVTSTLSLTTNTIAFACDGTSGAIFQVTSVAGTGVFHVTGAGTPGNCSTGLGVPTNCATPTAPAKTFQPGGYLSPLTAAAWYVGNNSRGGRSLFRSTPATGAEEIAEGVVDMQLTYLLRDVATGNLESDWVDAAAITNWTTAASKQVVAVRVVLALQSLGREGTNQQALERELVHVVSIRERNL